MAKHICPVWMGYFLASGLRKLLHNPTKLIGPYVTPDMTVLDLGCAMGFFSLPMAEAVGPEGKVVCVDVQPRMLAILKRRAARVGLADRIETHVCRKDSIALDDRAGSFDFALAFAVLHEVADQEHTWDELAQLLKPNAHLLLAEPAGHVTEDEVEQSVSIARKHGFVFNKVLLIRWAHAALLTRTVS
ncbi:MAG: class I SAM-dependent methyltransferase [Phycisphaerales bacterium]|nr:MAG: class I SAM-dependent methyltransferase [Phycisphaerales bacterium]